MWTPVKLNNGKTERYGFGWALGEINKHRLIEHGGSWQGFKSFIARYPEQRLTVIVFANLARANLERLTHGVAAIYYPELAPPLLKAIEDKEPTVTAMIKELLQKFVEGTVDLNLFSPELKARITPDMTKSFGENLKSLGTLIEIQLVERKDNNNRRVYRYRLIYKGAALVFFMNLNIEGKIVLIDAQPEYWKNR
jgi:hypothetical protein